MTNDTTRATRDARNARLLLQSTQQAAESVNKEKKWRHFVNWGMRPHACSNWNSAPSMENFIRRRPLNIEVINENVFVPQLV